jgi:hypothetical protein
MLQYSQFHSRQVEGSTCRVTAVAGGSEWRRKPLESLKTGSEMGPCLLPPKLPTVQLANLTASPVEGPVSSPSHITRRPRTIVPTGQPVTVFPS